MGSKFTIPVLASILILGIFGFSGTQEAYAATFTAAQNGDWNVPSTWVGGFVPTTNADDTVTIPNGITVTNSGFIINIGTINNSGTFINTGSIINIGTINNSGTFINTGFIENHGFINNSGTFNNSVGIIDNFGTINNTCAGILIGDVPNVGNAVVQAPCGPPTIQIIVDTTDGDGSFVFTIFNATNPADKQEPVNINTLVDNSSSPLPVQAGTYSVLETVPLNWNLESSDCLIDGASHGQTLNFNIFNGQTVVCTFVNLFVGPPEPTCTLPDVDNAPPSQCENVPVNQICFLECDAGFEPVPPTLTCQDDGEFDASPVCQAIPEPTKVEVCHKNKKTLSINPDSVDDHIGHGDTKGACEPEDNQKKVKDSEEKKVKEPKEEKQKKPKKSKK